MLKRSKESLVHLVQNNQVWSITHNKSFRQEETVVDIMTVYISF
jgi:hypothetical protein